MKAKHVFVTLGVALTMGLGIAAGVGMSKGMQPAKAATTTIYCKMEHSWWTADGAAVGLYCWKADNKTAKATWPGERMTAVSGEANMWKFDVDTATYPNVIFVRVNGSGAISDWGAKTQNLTFPTDGKNFFTITNSSVTWGDPGCTGTWSTYDPTPVTHTYSYSINGATPVNMIVNPKNEDEQISATALDLHKGDKLTFKRDGAAYVVNPKDDGLLTKVYLNGDDELVLAEDFNDVIYLDTTSAKLWAGQFTSGHYLYGSFCDWNLKEGIKATKQEDNNVYYVNSLELDDEAEVKMIYVPTDSTSITYYNADASKVSTSTEVAYSVTGEFSNLKVLNSGTYDIYYNVDSGWYSIEDCNYDPSVIYSYSLNGAAYVDMDVNPKNPNEVYADNLDLSKGDTLTFQRNGVDLTVTAKDTNLLTNVFVNEDDELELAVDYEDGIYLDITSNKLWAGQFESGYYLCGSFCDWNVKLSTPAELEELGKQVYYVNSIALLDNAEMKMIYIPNDSATVTYYNADASKVSTNTGVEYSVTEGDSNLKVASGSNYGVYYDVESGWYGIEDREYHEPVYTLKIGDGEPIEMTKGDDNQYYVSGVDLPGDVVLSYAVDGVTVDDSTAKVVANNNMKANKHVLATVEDVDVYVNVSTKTIWAGGLEYGTYYLFKNYASDRQAIELTYGDPFEEYDQYYSALLSFEKDDTIEFINTGVHYEHDDLPSIFHPGIINEGGLGNKFEIVDNVITCKTDAPEVSVYLKLKYGMDEVYFGDKPEYVDDAIKFAENFNSLIGTACSIENLGNREAQVKAKWAQMATAWGELSELSQNYLKTDKSNPTVQAFNAKYDSVLALRGTAWALNDFMAKNNPSNTIRPINVIGSNSALLITLVAVSALIVSGALAFYVLRKKRLAK